VTGEVPERIWWCLACNAGVGVWGLDRDLPPPRCPDCKKSEFAPTKFVPTRADLRSAEPPLPTDECSRCEHPRSTHNPPDHKLKYMAGCQGDGCYGCGYDAFGCPCEVFVEPVATRAILERILTAAEPIKVARSRGAFAYHYQIVDQFLEALP